MRLIPYLLFFVFFNCQNDKLNPNDIDTINLSYTHTLNNESVIINIQQYQTDNIILSYKYTPKTEKNIVNKDFKIQKITKQQFGSIVKSIDKIDRSNIEKEAKNNGLDSSSSSISFQKKSEKTIINIYSIWTPDYKTNERNLDDYLNTYSKLLKLAKIEPDTIFN